MNRKNKSKKVQLKIDIIIQLGKKYYLITLIHKYE